MFEQVVFAGGGNRCWWQAGWWDVVAPAISLKPRVIAGVSAAAPTACMTYVQPSKKVPISAWDYADPAAMHLTYDQGRGDGERFAEALRAG
ncbi:MAG: patatin-like phospholipase family protein [Burkholderiaceae bacterium]